MNTKNTFGISLVFLFGVLVMPYIAFASASDNFFEVNGDIYDDWGIFRTRAVGQDGFLGVVSTGFSPIVAYESLGEDVDVAWEIGARFAQMYPNRAQRAEEIFYFVRNNVRYTSDSEQFGLDEFSQNADEVMQSILSDGLALGDCEDSAILLAVMYKAAGYRSAIVLMPGHVATLVYFPEYRKAPRKLAFDGEDGWVWAEATGATNPLGWVPESLVSNNMMAKEITMHGLTAQDASTGVVAVQNKASTGISRSNLFGFLGPIGFLWLMSSGRRRSLQGRGK
jgi:hypothetical protein